jgi:hypothetical protein
MNDSEFGVEMDKLIAAFPGYAYSPEQIKTLHGVVGHLSARDFGRVVARTIARKHPMPTLELIEDVAPRPEKIVDLEQYVARLAASGKTTEDWEISVLIRLCPNLRSVVERVHEQKEGA